MMAVGLRTGAWIIFGLTYVAIAGLRFPGVAIDRPAAALLGAVAMVASGILPLDEALRAVNLETIVLLLGMMIIAAYLIEAHFFKRTAWWVLTRARSARSLLWGLVFVSGGLSALLVNDTVCLMFTPLVLAVVYEAQLPPLPYLLGLAAATNVGGVVTFTGNPQNMIVAMAAKGTLGYGEYLRLTLPIGIVSLALVAAILTVAFRRVLPVGPLADRAPPKPYVDVALMAKALGALVLFVALAVAGRSLAGAAVTAAAALVLVAQRPPRESLDKVDWVLLLFFAGLFVVVRGLESSGALADVTNHLAPLLARGDATGLILFAALTVVGSNVISNVPFVVVAVRAVAETPEPRWGYVVLAVASTLAGNLTLFGSVANLIVFEAAGPSAPISFGKFLRYGVVITAATMAVAMAILLGERALGW